MVSFQYTIKEPLGIHARPAGLLAKRAKTFPGEICIQKGDRTANAAKLLAVMGLGIKCGDRITVTLSGEGEETALGEIEAFFTTHF